MTPYFMLECPAPHDTPTRDLDGYPALDGIDSWFLGAPFAHPPAGPVRLCWDSRTRGAKKPLYTSNIPLMHRGLLDAMRSAGIDNIDAYPAEVLDLETQEVDGDYVAFNVLGAVRAADLARSQWADPSHRRRIDMDFDSLAIATDAARGLLLFRLAECVSGLVVHHALRRPLENAGYGLMFVPPDEWLG